MSIKKFKSKETVEGFISLKEGEAIETLIPITLLILKNVSVNKYECMIIAPNSMVTNLIRDNYFEKSSKNYLFTELELNHIVSKHSEISLKKKNNEIEKSCISNEEDKKKTSSSEKCQARWHAKIGSFTVRQEGVLDNNSIFTCPNTSVGQSKFWNQKFVCETCHAFGRSVYQLKQAFLPVMRILKGLMKEPAKAKAVEEKMTNFCLKIAGTNPDMIQFTRYLKNIVDTYYPGEYYLERALRINKNSTKKSNTSRKNSDTSRSELYSRPKVSKPELPKGHPVLPPRSVNQYWPKSSFCKVKLRRKTLKDGEFKTLAQKNKFVSDTWKNMTAEEKKNVIFSFKMEKEWYKFQLDKYKKENKNNRWSEYSEKLERFKLYQREQRNIKKNIKLKSTGGSNKKPVVRKISYKKKPVIKQIKKNFCPKCNVQYAGPSGLWSHNKTVHGYIPKSYFKKTKVSVTPSIKPKVKYGNDKSNSKIDNMVSLQKNVNFDHNLFHKGNITVDKKKNINCCSKFKLYNGLVNKKVSDEEMRKLGFNDYINYMTDRYDESIGSSSPKSCECKFLTHPFNRTAKGNIQRCWKCKLVMNGEEKIENKKFGFWRNELTPARYHYLCRPCFDYNTKWIKIPYNRKKMITNKKKSKKRKINSNLDLSVNIPESVKKRKRISPLNYTLNSMTEKQQFNLAIKESLKDNNNIQKKHEIEYEKKVKDSLEVLKKVNKPLYKVSIDFDKAEKDRRKDIQKRQKKKQNNEIKTISDKRLYDNTPNINSVRRINRKRQKPIQWWKIDKETDNLEKERQSMMEVVTQNTIFERLEQENINQLAKNLEEDRKQSLKIEREYNVEFGDLDISFDNSFRIYSSDKPLR